MRIVSFDPGIRNLAYCVLDGTSRSDVKIVDWNIIDVLGEQAGVGTARCFKCAGAARYEHAGNGTFACSRHTPKTGKPPTKTALSKQSIETIRASVAAAGIQTTATKKADLVTLLYNHARQTTWKKCVSSARSGSVFDQAAALVRCLEARSPSWANATIVAIENQPERRMYAVQAMLHMYFTMKNLRCEGVSATHKLTNMVTVEDNARSYKGRKKTGILHASALIPESNRDHFLRHPKKDDLADAFLQGLWVLEHTR